MKNIAPRSYGRTPFWLQAGSAIFLGAFLMFQLELITGKLLLPDFGSSASVWVTCLVFFQFALLLGYGYAHVLSRFSLRWQALVHVAAAAVILAGVGWRIGASHTLLSAALMDPARLVRRPVAELVWLLTLGIGAPFVLLATTSSLVQAWYARVTSDTAADGQGSGSTYRLYALSNAGSLLGLLAYPFLVELLMPLRLQQAVWTAGLLVYGACLVSVAARASAWGSVHRLAPAATASSGRGHQAVGVAAAPPAPAASFPPSAIENRQSPIACLLLSACGSALLVSTTNQLCQDVSPIPMLWVLPLAVYLLTFILAFSGNRTVLRLPSLLLSALGAGVAWATLHYQMQLRLLPQVGGHIVALFLTTLACHTALYQRRPPAQDLTRFYLLVAAGGAIGGILAGAVAPMALNGLWEYPIALVASVVLATGCECGLVWPRPPGRGLQTGVSVLKSPAGAGGHVAEVKAESPLPPPQSTIARPWSSSSGVLWVIPAIAGLLLWQHSRQVLDGTVLSTRSFYGALHVTEQIKGSGANQLSVFSLLNGRIAHGMQPNRSSYRFRPSAYFTESSGLGLGVARVRELRGDAGPLRLGVIGLGVGTVAAYGRPGDEVRFYEINPDVIRIAHDERYFTYLAECRAKVDVVEGDARLTMAAELARGAAQAYDILVLDAFSGDAIPSHLLTREAFDIYLRHLAPNGLIAWHATNRHVDFAPLGVAIARDRGMQVSVIDTPGDMRISAPATWILMTRNEALLASPAIQRASVPPESIHPVRVWTDDFNTLYALLKIRQPERSGLLGRPTPTP